MESKNIILDTNVWVSLFNDKDINHNKVKKSLGKFLENQIMPDLVFYETITVLKFKAGLDISVNFIDFAKDNKDITIKLFYEDNRDLIALIYDDRFRKLSYTDILLLYLSRKNTIVTFDKELIKNIKLIKGRVMEL